jgi:hypothetical protein
VASAYRELGGSRVGATKICVKVARSREAISRHPSISVWATSAIKKDRWHRKSGIGDPRV